MSGGDLSVLLALWFKRECPFYRYGRRVCFECPSPLINYMPSRTTRKSYRSRVTGRTMVDTINRTACPRQKPKASSHRQHESAEKEKIKTTLHRMGWMAERTSPLPSVVGEVFLLDIPFYRTRLPSMWVLERTCSVCRQIGT